MNEKVVELGVTELQPGAGNRRYGGFDPTKLQQLADSITAVGIQQPLVVRRMTGESYEIVCGERRWRAAQLAGLTTVPCVVRELDDATALKIRTVENLQREDIHPLDEAEGYESLRRVGGLDVDQIAQEVGKSPSYVYQRLKLRELVPEARKLLEEGTITAGHAILIARLLAGDQKEIAHWCRPDRYDREPPSVRNLSAQIEQSILMRLKDAAFKKDDAELLPEAGACATCQKRTGYEPALFADVGKDDRCLDRTCFGRKLDAVVARKAADLKGAGVVRVHGRGMSYNEEKRDPKAVHSYDYQPAKKGDKGAVPLLVTTGPDRGQMYYAKKATRSAFRGLTPAQKKRQEDDRAKQKEKERQRQSVAAQLLRAIEAEMSRTGHIAADVLQVMARQTLKELYGDRLVRVTTMLGLEHKGKKQDELRSTVETLVGTLTAEEIPLYLVRTALVDLYPHTWDYPGSPDEFGALAKARGIKPEPAPKAKGKPKTEKAPAPAKAGEHVAVPVGPSPRPRGR